MKSFTKKIISSILAVTVLFTSISPSLSNASEKISKNREEKIEARAVPLVFVILAEAAALYYGGKKITDKVRESTIENAIAEHFDLYFYGKYRDLMTWKVGTGKEVVLECGDDDEYGLEHILARHVPKYFHVWLDDGTNSYFDVGTDVEDIVNELDYVIKKYKSKISQDGFKNGEQAFSVIGSDGRKYKLVIKGSKVITFYPDGWNIAKIE
ncbi:hypothetical protein [Brevibacillus gelatini]